ncbi:hypothetical protein DIU31_006270 [Mucilaginibacter rubeus]|uniref:Uncharacterized protein n=1 Tax=Mucilaginibacter rubeus TaxID=2027860 RepID=A0AAE6JCS3_9SPHI|nr:MULTISPECIES: hypothetical protein [Mucilaginibacter]QEM03146.1 hypothetical protein DIU31_006270 [Mucilaginibacter rubeus]QEM15765.1 hypothetical protein DIU38_006345 [Mucilaginibacter gossypii]QTE41495.1 hypothetical protein J3L19_21430 [Mucilaginibacter rubeus]QTE48100.1 hypothetical protein J3L21_21425 [Mucilaginibacter rubeus]QTE59492.1 hypothetical protein J3L23_13080 [Mucilaginibacter rubeus]
MQEQVKLPKLYLDILNQVFEIEKKLSQIKEPNSIQRNVNRLKESFENMKSNISNEPMNIIYKDPIGEDYNETRTDCEASIAGITTENLVIVEVIKPIIYCQFGGQNIIAQKGVVVVEEQKN